MAKEHHHRESAAGIFKRKGSREIRIWPSVQLRPVPEHTTRLTTLAMPLYRIPTYS